MCFVLQITAGGDGNGLKFCLTLNTGPVGSTISYVDGDEGILSECHRASLQQSYLITLD